MNKFFDIKYENKASLIFCRDHFNVNNLDYKNCKILSTAIASMLMKKIERYHPYKFLESSCHYV